MATSKLNMLVESVELDYYENRQRLVLQDGTGVTVTLTMGGAVDPHDVGESVTVEWTEGGAD